MLKKIQLLVLSVLLSSAYMFAQSGLGTLKGIVRDQKSGEVIPSAKVYLMSGTSMKGNAITDDKGEFQINAILPGTYDVKVTNKIEGYQDALEQGVIISSDKIIFLEKLTLGKPENELQKDEVKVTRYKVT
jgi:hypothetical protein